MWIISNKELNHSPSTVSKPTPPRKLTDEQVRKLADSLKNTLGQQVAAELAKRLND